MSDHRANRRSLSKLWSRLTSRSRAGGQALVEYVLILTLVTLAIIAVLAITGPAVGNVFSNTVYNLLGGTIEPREPLEADEFWTQVAAVASFTPENPGLATNTPAPSTATPTVGPSLTSTPITPSPTPSNTPTPGPSPTPPDQNFGYPFEDDGSEQDWWKFDFDGVLGEWDAEYWNLSNTNGVSYESDMTSMPPGSGDWQTTHDELDFYWGGSPGGGITDNFYARYTTIAALEDQEYTLRLRKDDGMRVWVGGDLLFDEWSWSPSYSNWVEINFTPSSAGANDVVVELYDSGWGARAVVFIDDPGGMMDEGECNWALSDEKYRSPSTAWSDSPGSEYDDYSYCILALRGYIDLVGATQPTLEFWDSYDLDWGASAIVSVAIAGTNNWTDVVVHQDSEVNLSWSRQSFDLTNFGDPDGAGPGVGRDFSGEIVELRFILDNSGTWRTDPGWWIDDISVKNNVLKRYTVGFSDDMEGPENWYAGGTWALSNEAAHSGSQAWSDSPGGDYLDDSNSTLELDGVIDLDNAAVVDPQIVFWHRYALTYHDYIYAEVSTDGRYTWQPLTGSELAYQEDNLSWGQTVLSLSDYIGQEVYFRFRLDARSHSYTDDGWWIDDFSIRNKPSNVITPDWCDNMEGGAGSWIAEGTWAIVNGPDYNPDQPGDQTITAHSGSQFWSDSPGSNYVDDTNSSLVLNADLDLTGATDPEVVFWHQWDIDYTHDDLYLEVSTDDGSSWTDIWRYEEEGGMPEGYRYVPDRGYDTVLSWTRRAVDLSTYVGQVIKVRFRLDTTSSDTNVNDGWWIDDVCFQEHNEPVYQLENMSDGFFDNFESGDGNWYVGGDWTISTENVYERNGGSRLFTDSPGGVDYKHYTNAILELRGAVDLTNTVEPTLYFWETFDLTYNDYTLVEINASGDGGQTWTGWDTVFQHYRNVQTTSWDRRQVDLSSYVDKQVKIRFRLYAVSSTYVDDGWYVDDVWVVDRDGREAVHTLNPSFFENAETLNDYWVMDHTWDRVPGLRMIGSGAALGPGGWTAEYYQDDGDHIFEPGELIGTETYNGDIVEPGDDGTWPAPINTGSPFMIRWTRTINVTDDGTTYWIEARSDDGVRVIVDGNTVIDAWVNRGYNDNDPDVGSVTLDKGNHTVVVEYYEYYGNQQVRVDFGIAGQVFHDSPGDGVEYEDDNDMSLTLEGTIDLSGTANPTLSYWDKRDLGYGDSVRVEVSTDEGFNWTTLETQWGTDTTWRKRLIDLSSYAGQQITIRFRLDARSNSDVDDGWWLDDIMVAD